MTKQITQEEMIIPSMYGLYFYFKTKLNEIFFTTAK